MSYSVHAYLEANTDDGAQTINVDHNAYRHQIAIDCGESSGTFDITVLPVGFASFKTPANTSLIDLSGTTAVVLISGAFGQVKVTPSGVASDTDYTVVITSWIDGE